MDEGRQHACVPPDFCCERWKLSSMLSSVLVKVGCVVAAAEPGVACGALLLLA